MKLGKYIVMSEHGLYNTYEDIEELYLDWKDNKKLIELTLLISHDLDPNLYIPHNTENSEQLIAFAKHVIKIQGGVL